MFWPRTLKFFRFHHTPQTKHKLGEWKGAQPPWLIGFNEIHRPLRWPHMGTWHSGLQENMHTDGVWCATAQIQSKFRGGPGWESGNLQFDPQLLGYGISLMVSQEGGSPFALVTCPTKSGLVEQTIGERSTCKHGICLMYTNLYCWGKNSGLKGFQYMHVKLHLFYAAVHISNLNG